MKESILIYYGITPDYNKNEKLIIIENDASRFIVGLGVYNEETIDNTMETLEHAIELYGKPNEIITDNGN